MAKTTSENDKLLATLNADLRARDPMRTMRQEIRSRTLAEVRLSVHADRPADGTHAGIYDRVEAIIGDLERVPARA